MKRILYSLVSLVVLIILLVPTSGLAAADTTKPTISGATNTTVYLNQTFNSKKGVTAKDNVDGNITSLIGISGKVDTKKTGKYTLTYKVTDTAKNTTTVKRVVTVKKDTTQPNITGATNKTAYLGYSFDAKTGVKATDNADGTITSKIKITGLVNTKKEGTYKLKYSVTDKGKNTRTVTRVITVKKDKEKPKITGATNKTVYKGYSFNPKTSVAATDNVDGNITSKIIISGKVNVNEVGIYKLQYTAKDKTGNKTTVTRTITIKKDTTKPQITGAGDKTINYGESFDPKSGVKATDNLDGTITSKMMIIGSVNMQKVGTYKLVYSVKDKTDNKTTVTRTINVVDKIKPMLKGTGLDDAAIAIGKPFDLLRGITADDNADGNLTSEIKIEGTVNVQKGGTYSLVYSVTDKSGNKATAERAVAVIDNIAPTISGVGNISVRYFDSFDPMKGVTSSDNNDGDLTSKVVVKTNGPEVDPFNIYTAGTYSYEYSVSDEAGNTTTVKRQVELIRRNAEFYGTGDVKINIGETFDPLEGVTATDMGNGEDVTSFIEVSGYVDANYPGTYTFSYNISTEKAISTRVQRKVTVVDNIPPEITGVYDRTVDLNYSLPDLLKGVEANDNIDGDLTRKIDVDTQNVDTSTEGEYVITYFVTDRAGNKTEVQSTITVKKVPVTELRVFSDTDYRIVKPGETFEVHTNAYPNNASFTGVTSWESSDETVATVDEKGVVKTLADGTVTFTATVDGVKGSVTITVSGKPDLRFYSWGWGPDYSTKFMRVGEVDFELINKDKETVAIDSVKVFDADGSVLQTYSPVDLVKMGVVTSIGPSSSMNMKIDFEDGKGPIVNGSRLSVFGTIQNGNTYEYSIKFRD
ncbi:immunoglobulin-like domain-containing protein [Peribacillus frigoritolerans]|uniref:immunoglobulin-like domain-containing protein n=1 Tax=Peribacillus frigoritolerans TaxID=450367 RepID=UPI003D2BBE36